MKLNMCFCKQKTAYEFRISDWISDVCSSDLIAIVPHCRFKAHHRASSKATAFETVLIFGNGNGLNVEFVVTARASLLRIDAPGITVEHKHAALPSTQVHAPPHGLLRGKERSRWTDPFFTTVFNYRRILLYVF